MKIISAATEIGAPPMTVWAILTDLGRYPEWNPLFREASGEIAVGNLITLNTYAGYWPEEAGSTRSIIDAALGNVPQQCPDLEAES